MENDYISQLSQENAYLKAVAHGLSDKLFYAESLLAMAMDFMTSIDYETAIDSVQCVAIATEIKRFLCKESNDNE